MNIIVCIKQVPSIEDLKLRAGEEFNPQGFKRRANLFDIFAIEEAMTIKDQFPQTVITLLSMGTDTARRCLIEGLAMGADKAYHIDSHGQHYDTIATARILAAAIHKIEDIEGPADIIFAGNQATDSSSGMVPYMLSELLSRQLLSSAAETRLIDDYSKAEITKRSLDRFEKAEGSFPLIISATKPNHEVRYPTFKRIREANQAEIFVIDSSHLGQYTSATEVIKVIKPGRDSKNSIVNDDYVQAGTRTLLHMLKEDKIFAR